MDYLEYAYLQIAQNGPAKEVVDELIGFRQSEGANLAGGYAVAAIPVRYALERRDWPTAAALSDPAIDFPLERFPWERSDDRLCPRTGRRAGGEHRRRRGGDRPAAIARRQAEGQRQRHLLGQPGRGPAFGGRRHPRPY